MSAFIVEKNHILYLVSAAMALTRGGFTWHVDDPTQPGGYRRGELRKCDYERAAEVANMLWRENVASVSHRYPNESSSTLPGPSDRSGFVITARDFTVCFDRFEPAQVCKACDCYDYQSCEHNGWNTCESKAFTEMLRRAAMNALPGYDSAKWGAPQPHKGQVCLSALAFTSRR
jgi:hypothetical protein